MADWITEYVEYARNNEASEEFHWFSAATILGAALKRNVVFAKGYFKLYPCLWTLIVSPSGTKKTAAVQIAYNLLSKLDHVRMLADKNSPEGLVDDLVEPNENGVVESQGLLFAPELANFLDRRSHNDGLIQLMLRLSDTPDVWTYRTRGGGPKTLKNVAVSFLGATANDLLYECVPALALKSGFLARFVVVPGTKAPTHVPFPWKDPQLESSVLDGLYQLSLLKGEMQLPSVVNKWYVEWYFAHKATATKLAATKLRAYAERKPDHLLRLAMIVSISQNRRLEFTKEAFEIALAHLEEVEKGLPAIYDDIDASPTGRDQNVILKQLERAGGRMSHSELVKGNYATMDSSNLKGLIRGLCEAKLVDIQIVKGKGYMYVLTKQGEKHG